ncbi:Thiol-disulfide oxidoreductase [Tenacibaculum sp. 190130A14a]|uniref:Cytochrome c biogenesis protein CcmG, thiol:disulfide interchange protein DsbE n=1 Tax=Tenacibaculum polynesiense TaxID=3137857 RepID=A0ABP1EXR2_9FLAO
MIKFLKKHYSNILFLLVLGLLLFPSTRVYFIRLISFSPSVNEVKEQVHLDSYEWNLKGLNAQNINFKEEKGKVIFVSFWATWCPPCIAELPSIKKLHQDYGNKVSFLLVTNEDWGTVSKFYEKNEYNFPTYNYVSAVPSKLQSNSIPATFILDKSGKIIVDKKGPANWNTEKIRSLLDDLLAK